MSNTERVSLSYHFLSEAEHSGHIVTLQEIAAATQWKATTIRTYPSKKWKPFLTKEGNGFRVKGVAAISEASYLRHMSQVHQDNSLIDEESLPPRVEALLLKSVQAVTLAVDIYNRPATTFRTEGYLMLMVTGWTALFHAMFERDGIDYRSKDKNGNVTVIDGDDKAWDLSNCLRHRVDKDDAAVQANLTLIILLRNKVEHRFVPAFDLQVTGECQALLLNFERLLVSEFGERFALSSTLAVPLQLSSYRPPQQRLALKELEVVQLSELRTFLDGYRASLPDDVYADPKFSFRVYLIPKTGNHESSSDLSLEFVDYDPNDENFQEIQRRIAITRERRVPVANQGKFRPNTVVDLIARALGIPFTMNDHTKSWKAYEARKPGLATPQGCNPKFCQYDEAHRDYIYTDEWVSFLIERLKDPDELLRVRRFGKR